MGKKQTFFINFEGVSLMVEGYYSPGRAGKAYLSNGDPGYPPEDPEFEIDKVFLGEDRMNDITDLMENANFIRYVSEKDKPKRIIVESYFERITSECLRSSLERDRELLEEKQIRRFEADEESRRHAL